MQTMIRCLSVVDAVAAVVIARVDGGRAGAAGGASACGHWLPRTASCGGQGRAAALPTTGTSGHRHLQPDLSLCRTSCRTAASW